MSIPSPTTYLADLIRLAQTQWPDNRTINIVCHGHSVPAGYFATPLDDTFNAYPHLLHVALKHRFPYAVFNVIVTAIGGEHARSGRDRFTEQVLCHRPDVVSIDYALNDRDMGLQEAEISWRSMIEPALARNVKVILMTPTPDCGYLPFTDTSAGCELAKHAAQIRRLAGEYNIGLADSTAAFERYMNREKLDDLLSWTNHPNRNGHELAARELMRWFATI